ncbi:yrdC domain-containing protein, mitochondrial [Leptopilina heterotoma]|uniref:yrdC domain-containing protein, mitochondrial n=1 Tax=Leptopilina heterotoma TaxID=63436 RepID=UPI001CA85995|nr:yrdC domain-containing protein, mitochondrial [Leptopilina heterotoma]
MMNPDYIGPLKDIRQAAVEELKSANDSQHWFCGGDRSIGIAVELIKNFKIIAVPTDTIFGLTGLAQNSSTVQKLNAIKRRDENKFLSICVSDISEINTWGEASHLSIDLLEKLLPGPVTIVLKRTDNLNPELNPGISTIGIRIPDSDFLRCVIKYIGEPLALTSANESNCPSTLHPDEFKSLWPYLGGIFHDNANNTILRDKRKLGSTIVDLSEPGCYKLIRPGMACSETTQCLLSFGLKRIKERRSDKKKNEEAQVQAVVGF